MQDNEDLRRQLEERGASGGGGDGDDSAALAAANARIKGLEEQLVKNAREQAATISG